MTILTVSIPNYLSNYPLAGLIQIPAINHKLPRLSSYLGQEIYILRDDLTGFGIGGNKTRKVDFLVKFAIYIQGGIHNGLWQL